MSDQDYREIHYGAGIFSRKSKKQGMALGEVVLGHRHGFDHVTFVTRGVLRVSLLTVTKVNAYGDPLDAKVEFSKILRADDDEEDFFLVLKGRWHTLESMEEGTRYRCMYASRLPQSITMHLQGDRKTPPLMKRDENGVLWYREDPHIVETSEWAEAYR